MISVEDKEFIMYQLEHIKKGFKWINGRFLSRHKMEYQ